MSHSVQADLEKMVLELEELRICGIFDDDEIKMIIKKRREQEHLIRSINKYKLDFLRYMQYEMNLEILKRKRMKRLGIKSVGTATSYSPLFRIQGIFRRSLAKYRDDVRLWMQYICYLLAIKSFKSLGKTFMEALHMHPMVPDFWILAASWEYTYNFNTLSARRLFQRGIRVNSNSDTLYTEYFRLELLICDENRSEFKIQNGIPPEQDPEKELKLLNRSKKTLSIDLGNVPGGSAGNDQDTESFIRLLNDEEEQGTGREVIEEKVSIVKHMQSHPSLSYKIPEVIFRGAIKAIPKDIQMRKRFVWLAQRFEGTDNLQNLIYESLKTEFGTDPHILSFIMLRPMHTYHSSRPNPNFQSQAYKEVLIETLTNFETHLKQTKDPEFVMEYLNFCMEQYQVNSLSTVIKGKIKSLQEDKSLPLNYGIYLQLCRFFLKCSETSTAITCLSEGIKKFPENVQLWCQYIRMIKLFKDTTLLPQIPIIFDDAFAALKKVSNTLPLYQLFIEDILETNSNSDELIPALKRGLCIDGEKALLLAWRLEIFLAIQKYCKEDLIRKLYNVILQHPPVSVKLYKKFIKWEVKLKDAPTFKKEMDFNKDIIRTLFTEATKEFGTTDHKLWLMYWEWETSMNEFSKSSTIYFQAKSTLTNPAAFIESHARLLTGIQEDQ